MWSVSKEIYMYQQNYHSMQTWIILEQKDNDNSEMISANCAVGHSLKKGRVHMLFICQRGLQGFQVVKRSPYILLPFEQLKKQYTKGGTKKNVFQNLIDYYCR